jgi:hypothetical protein
MAGPALSSLTSLGELRTVPPVSTTGLVTEIGLVKADSRLEEKDPDLCSTLLAFHALGYMGIKYIPVKTSTETETQLIIS